MIGESMCCSFKPAEGLVGYCICDGALGDGCLLGILDVSN